MSIITVDLSYVRPDIINYVDDVISRTYDREDVNINVKNILKLTLIIQLIIYNDIFDNTNISHLQIRPESKECIEKAQDLFDKLVLK